MKPIQERAETALIQALRCVQFRTPNTHRLKPKAYAYSLALRYGLVGAAASYYALEIADPHEEHDLRHLFQCWPVMVIEHLRSDARYGIPFAMEDSTPVAIGRLSSTPLKVSLALRKQFLPLQRVLEIASDVFQRDHRSHITSESWIFQRSLTARQFRNAAEDSIRFAVHFFERRRCGLDEVSEIALLGE